MSEYNPVWSLISRQQELLDKENNMNRKIPKNAVAVVITRDSEEGFLDLQVLPPEQDDADGYLTSIANLAVNLLEQAMFGEEDDEDGFELDPDFVDSIDFGDEED